MKILCSACLCGCACRYDGRSTRHPLLERLAGFHELIPVCPEVLGGLGIPRSPVELRQGRVLDSTGKDWTPSLRQGVDSVMKMVDEIRPDLCILQQRSPSCGHGLIYDGTFTGRLAKGEGLLSRALLDRHIPILPGDQLDSLQVARDGSIVDRDGRSIMAKVCKSR